MIKKKDKGFALILSLVLLLAMSLMGGALIVISSGDHQSNNTSDEYQQTFYVAETALLQAQKSLMDQMIGPLNRTGGTRNYAARSIPINKGTAPDQTVCFRSFRNLSRDSDFRVVEHLQDQSFLNLILPIFDNISATAVYGEPEEISIEQEKLSRYRYEFFTVNVGSEEHKAEGGSLKKGAGGAALQRGTAYRIYGCGMLGDVNAPNIIIPLETIIILSH
tara:strand:- start:1352 stop:2011 length:660 start_codon:yes stop_codon:yes gene_type:complete